MALAAIAGSIIFGGLNRIARTATNIVPFMAVIYIGTVAVALGLNIDKVPAAFAMIITDAFTGEAAAGGSVLAMMVYGVQRGAFSNEAGMGTESLVHGAVKTSEPIREGLVAMVGPIIDTLIICTATALMILVAGTWQSAEAQGVTLTASAFTQLLGPIGTGIIFLSVVSFATTTLFTYSFYGSQCASFVFGNPLQKCLPLCLCCFHSFDRSDFNRRSCGPYRRIICTYGYTNNGLCHLACAEGG